MNGTPETDEANLRAEENVLAAWGVSGTPETPSTVLIANSESHVSHESSHRQNGVLERRADQEGGIRNGSVAAGESGTSDSGKASDGGQGVNKKNEHEQEPYSALSQGSGPVASVIEREAAADATSSQDPQDGQQSHPLNGKELVRDDNDTASAVAGQETVSNAVPQSPTDQVEDEGSIAAESSTHSSTIDSIQSESGSPVFRRAPQNIQNITIKSQGALQQTAGRIWGNSRQFSYILHEQERLRYSWQSVQDEEPNRPRINIVKLVSNTTSASAGFPGGEALQFSISPGGRRIAAFNSARLYILQAAALPVGLSQDYALRRRPLAVEVIDDGDTVAILVDPHTVNIYDLGDRALQRVRTLNLDFPTNCVALGPTGGVLAAAYEGGVEIFSLASSALLTDRRAVRTQKMDKMTFSQDSSTLLGTTTRINISSTAIVSVPVFPANADGIPTHEELKAAWCSEMLQPENIRNSSHATYMREARAMCNDRLFAWNGLADTFGVLNVGDLQYGNLDFPVVISPPLSTCGGLGAAIHSCPAIDELGNTVAMIVNDRTVRLYLVPKADDDDAPVEAHSIDHELDEGYGNAFTDIRWVHSSAALPAPIDSEAQTQGRLIVASPGGVMEPNFGTNLSMEENFDEIEGGRIIIFDFDQQFVGQEGQTFSLTLGSAKPQMLDEEEVDVADEVALIRRRTVNQRKGGDLIHRPVVLGRSATNFSGRRGRGNMRQNLGQHHQDVLNLPDLVEDGETLDAFEQPYQQNAPRSHASLHRSATNVQRHRFQTLEERTREHIPVDAMGDAIPLPEYTEEPNAPLPSRYRALAGLDQPAPPPMNVKEGESSTTNQTTQALGTDALPNQQQHSPPHQPQQAQQQQQEAPQPSRPTAEHFEDYDDDDDELLTTGYPTHSSLYSDSYMAPLQNFENDVPPSRAHEGVLLFDPQAGPPQRAETFDDLSSLPRSLQRAYSTDPLTGRVGSRQTTFHSDFTSITPQSTFPISSIGQANDHTKEEDQLSEISPQQSHVESFDSRFGPQNVSPGEQPSQSPMERSASAEPSIWSPDSLQAHSATTREAYNPVARINGAALLPGMLSPHDGFNHLPMTAFNSNINSSLQYASRPGAMTRSTGSTRSHGHSRKSSVANRSAFASTAKAKNLGFFRGNTVRRKESSQTSHENDVHHSRRLTTKRSRGSKLHEAYAVDSKKDGKCVVM